MPASKRKSKEVDLRLAVLRSVVPEGDELSGRQIARACGIRHESVRKIERAAFKKLRIRIKGIFNEIHDQ